MARINIDIGVLGNPATGDTLRTAMTKINTNFTEVYSLVRDGSSGLIATDVTNGDLKLQANGTGAIEIDTLSITNSTITSITTNSDITLTPNGTGNVVLGNFTFNADQTVGASEDNYVFTYDHSTGTIGLEASAAGDVTASSTTTFTNKTFDANGTGNSISNIDIADFTSGVFLDEDNMASNSATAIASQQSIKAYVDAEDANIASDSMTFTNKSGNISQWTNDSNYATQAYVDARDIGDLSVTGSTISAPSNADLTLTTSGTGSVSIDGIQIKGTELSSSDSTQITIKENLHVTGNITGTLTGSVAFSNVTSTPTTIAGYGITDAASATATALTVVGDDSSGTAVTLGETFKVAGATGITTAVSGDTLTITGPSLTSYITASSSDTLTNKTIDANGTGNSISNIEVADFAGSAIINVAETLASNDSDTALVTAGAIIDYVDAQDANIASDTLTFTNKTFDVEGTGNSISNIDVADFKAAAIVTAAEGIGSNNNDTTIPTSAAVKAYADSVGGGSTGDLTISGSTISSPSNAPLTLDPSGTGKVTAVGGLVVTGGDTETADISSSGQIDAVGFTATGSSTFDGVQITDNTITSATSNADLQINASGTGTIVLENLKIGTSGSTVTTILDEDNMSSDSDTALATQQSIKAYVDSEISGVSGASTGDITFTGSTIQSPSNADITLDPSGTGGVVAQGPVTFNAGYIEKINALTSSSTITVNCALASIHTVTLGTSTEFNITNLPTGGSVTLIITQDGTGTRTATFGTDGSSAVKFPSNSSTLSTGGGDIDVVTIVNDGTNFLGNIAKDYRSS